jgi:uncharacterized protein (TIGR02996 family)
VAQVDRRAELNAQLAERPFDRSLRLVFADFLLEQGDVRGEVISLSDKSADLSLSERRRLTRLTELHAAQWVKSLSEIIDLSHSRFEGGFLSHLVCVAPVRARAWVDLSGDQTLATVRSLVLPAGKEAAEVSVFLQHPVLRQLTRLQASSLAWGLLGAPAQPSFTLETVAISSWGTFRSELEPVLRFPGLPHAKRVDLVTSEFVNPLVVGEVWEALLAQAELLLKVPELRLVARFGVIEGAVAWLITGSGAQLERRWPNGQAWSIDYGDSVYTLVRDEGRFAKLVIDLSFHQDLVGLGQRIATAASVLVQLAPAKLQRIEVQVPFGARVRAAERDSLRAAARRLGSVKEFSLAGATLTP